MIGITYLNNNNNICYFHNKIFNKFKYTLFSQSTYLSVGVPFSGPPRPSTNNKRRRLEGRSKETTHTSTICPYMYMTHKYSLMIDY